jgi:hypothetical protein
MYARTAISAYVAVVMTAGAIQLGCAPTLKQRWYACSEDEDCPSGWSCAGGRCSASEEGSQCVVDLNCDDGDDCTLDICDDGFCEHEPQDNSCDDGNFCNGSDECRDGRCENVGPPPCDDCDPIGDRCGECGLIDGPCCDGLCSQGACSEDDECVTCGALDGPCCGGGTCDDEALFCVDGRCLACGDEEEACCAGGFCNAPFQCTGEVCALSAGCGGVSCGSIEVCRDGDCVACGGLEQPCCADNQCSPNTVCGVNGLCRAPACGGAYEDCCVGPSDACLDASYVCTNDGSNKCVPCGMSAGSPCCPEVPGSTRPTCARGLDCDGTTLTCQSCGVNEFQICCDGECDGFLGLTCVRGYCRSTCGAPGQSCCAGNECGSGLTCEVVTNTCQ